MEEFIQDIKGSIILISTIYIPVSKGIVQSNRYLSENLKGIPMFV